MRSSRQGSPNQAYIAILAALAASWLVGNHAAGQTFELPKLFPGPPAIPLSIVIGGGDGYLYGTTNRGGGDFTSGGAIFRMALDGSAFTMLHAFSYSSDVASPNAIIISPEDGYLYGTTSAGGSPGAGTIFRMATDGSGFSVLHAFAGIGSSGPNAGVISPGNGYLYGTTVGGTVFRIALNGSSFTVLRNLSFSEWASLYVGVINPGDGYLYGTASEAFSG